MQLRRCSNITDNLLQECIRTGSKEYLNQLTIVNHVCNKVMNRYDMNVIKSLHVNKTFGSITLMRLLNWSQHFNQIDNAEQQEIRLDLVSLSRKERNIDLSRNQLEKYYNRSELIQIWNVNTLNIDFVYEMLTQGNYGHTIWNENTSRAVYEQCKLMYCMPGDKFKAIQLAASASTSMIETIHIDPNASNLSERVARFMLKLSEWIQIENNVSTFGHIDALIAAIPDVKTNHEQGMPNILSAADSMIGKLIQESTRQCPELAKSWYSLGAWFYRWGRKLVEQRNDRGGKLKTIDILNIKEIVPYATDEDLFMIGEIFNKHQAVPEEDDIGRTDSNTTEVIESQLRSVPCLKQASHEDVHAIVGVWKQAHKTVYRYYEKSAESYFKFLQLATTVGERIDDKVEGEYRKIFVSSINHQ